MRSRELTSQLDKKEKAEEIRSSFSLQSFFIPFPSSIRRTQTDTFQTKGLIHPNDEGEKKGEGKRGRVNEKNEDIFPREKN